MRFFSSLCPSSVSHTNCDAKLDLVRENVVKYPRIGYSGPQYLRPPMKDLKLGIRPIQNTSTAPSPTPKKELLMENFLWQGSIISIIRIKYYCTENSVYDNYISKVYCQYLDHGKFFGRSTVHMHNRHFSVAYVGEQNVNNN